MALWQYMFVKWLSIAFISFTLESIAIVVPIKEWKTCLNSESKIELFWGIAVNTCSKKCDVTAICSSFNYFPRGKFCELLADDSLSVVLQSSQRPCVHGLRSNLQSKHMCHGNQDECTVRACRKVAVVNATVLGNVYKDGSRIKVECKAGYRIEKDTLPTTCGEDGIWANIPACSASCPEPPSIPNANISTGNNSIGDNRTYLCNPDRVLRPRHGAITTTECLYNNTWTAANFRCLSDCGEPGHVPDAVLRPGNSLETDERTYKCNKEYVTPVNTTYLSIVCQSNGTWTSPLFSCIDDKGSKNGATSFVFGFLNLGFSGERHVYIGVSQPTKVVYSSMLENFKGKVTVSNGTELKLPKQFQMGTGIFPFGLYLQSNESIEVYIEITDSTASGGSVVIPETHLSKAYMLLSWNDDTQDRHTSVFAVVGTVDDTDVKVEFPNGSWYEITISRNQIYYYRTSLELTGTVMSSSESIAVFAGHGYNNGLIDHLFEQMPPISSLDTEFIVSYQYPRLNYAVRIAAVQDNTDIQLSNGTSFKLNRTKYLQQQLNNKSISISSSHPVLVAVFSLKWDIEYSWRDTYVGSMLIVPGLSQFKSEYNMFVPDSVERCVLMLTYPSYLSGIQHIRINHEPLIAHKSVDVIVRGRGKYTVLYTEMAKGFSVIYSTDGTPFGAYISFFRSRSESWFSLPYRF